MPVCQFGNFLQTRVPICAYSRCLSAFQQKESDYADSNKMRTENKFDSALVVTGGFQAGCVARR